ncbi:MAG: hypothetical protein HYW49_04565 [Deltaproteobacteria bacterium]|nr:hypothetical protein [Deltaproteobacteria bacterium]
MPGGNCPNCGFNSATTVAGRTAAPAAPFGSGEPAGAPPELTSESGFLPFRFFATIRELIFNPSRFFAARAAAIIAPGGITSVLAFALIVDWLASFFHFIWRTVAGSVLQRHFTGIVQIAGDVMEKQGGSGGAAQSLEAIRSRAMDFFFGAGTLLLSPFLTLVKLGFMALLVHAAVRFFFKEHADRPHSYAATLKILAFARAPVIFCIVPVLGVLAALILCFVVAVIGLRDVYRTTTFRASVAAFFPELFFIGIFLSIFFMFIFMGVSLFRFFS